MKRFVPVLVCVILTGCGGSASSDKPAITTNKPTSKPAEPSKPTSKPAQPVKPEVKTPATPQTLASPAVERKALVMAYTKLNKGLSEGNVSICKGLYTNAGRTSIYSVAPCEQVVVEMGSKFRSLEGETKKQAQRELSSEFLSSTIKKVTFNKATATVLRVNEGTVAGNKIVRTATDRWVKKGGHWKLDKRTVVTN